MQRENIGFKAVRLFKAQSLGVGSYGAVCKAKCDDLLGAAKLLHPILFDPEARSKITPEEEHKLPISRFERECEFLGLIKHPNIVQYLGTHRDPENGLPVLLMELMDQSLTSFLETSHQSLPYHTEVSISHDIALALSFLHSNGIIHRDLSSNNVLMIGNSRAKVTDFGMAKLAGSNSQASLTQTPGADVYMSPEATHIPPVYTEKIDCFSHGVLGIQIMSRQFPKPGARLKMVEIADPKFPAGKVRVAIPEVERRQEHIILIDQSHPLLLLALECLKDEEGERPSAREICEKLAALRNAPKFSQSTQDQAELQKQSADNMQLRNDLKIRDQENQKLKQQLADALKSDTQPTPSSSMQTSLLYANVDYANVDYANVDENHHSKVYSNVGKPPGDQLLYANLDGTEPKQSHITATKSAGQQDTTPKRSFFAKLLKPKKDSSKASPSSQDRDPLDVAEYASVEKPRRAPSAPRDTGHEYANINEKKQQPKVEYANVDNPYRAPPAPLPPANDPDYADVSEKKQQKVEYANVDNPYRALPPPLPPANDPDYANVTKEKQQQKLEYANITIPSTVPPPPPSSASVEYANVSEKKQQKVEYANVDNHHRALPPPLPPANDPDYANVMNTLT